MKKLALHSIKSRLIIGYGSMALLLVTVVIITLLQIGQILVLGFDVLNNKQPSRLHLQKLTYAVAESNIATQSYLLTGDEVYKETAEKLWKIEVTAARDSVDSLLHTWDNPENLIGYEKVIRLIDRIRIAQNIVLSDAQFGSSSSNISLYNYSNINGDTIIGVYELESWLNQTLRNQSDETPDNGALFSTKLQPLNTELNLATTDLYNSLKEEADEAGVLIYKERTIFVIVESIIVIGSVLLCFLLFRFVLRKVTGSIDVVRAEVETLSAGNIPDGRKSTDDELDIVLQELDSLSKNLADVKAFALEVGKGSFDNDITVFNNEGEIGVSLAEMRDSLKQVSEEAKVRNWSNKGFAEFGDILRKHSNDLSSLSEEVISYMVKYLGANQGSLFILEENSENTMVLQLKATYAYDRKKFLEKSIEKGQGLVGQAFLEKQSIYMKEIPENYVTITSGLGRATPTTLFIAPLIVNDEVYGVIELGSFRDFKEHERNFIQEVSENIASSIQSVKVNEKTNILLEESQQMTEEMRAQEEEMRQNMEELQATQEEMERNQRENTNRFNAIDNSDMCFIEFNQNGIVTHADRSFLALFEYGSSEEIEGQPHSIFVPSDFVESGEYSKHWERLRNGENISGEFKRITKSGKTIYIMSAYSSIKDESGNVVKVMKFANDITHLKEQIMASANEKEALLATIEEIKASLTSQEPADNKNIKSLIAYQETLKKELSEKLSKNEDALKTALAKQKKDLGLS
ncbi:MAG: PAS domain S-box-containing protein [Marivirga sp.]|jgi:PAS domain S-box-containing protein